jgi:hypothetical protein
VKLSLEEFEDDMDVVDILDHFLKTYWLDAGTREGAHAYKLDEAAEWVKWAEEVDLAMSALTGPESPTLLPYLPPEALGHQNCLWGWRSRGYKMPSGRTQRVSS